jgi:signal transduction histidine kinase/PAS domain-containing protein/ActR/RegA family two-component response regulator
VEIASSRKRSWKFTLFRYSLPVILTIAALLLQGILQKLLPRDFDFPFAFFYLVAAFVSAWYGGYAPGIATCVLVIAGFPLAAEHFEKIPPIDLSRLILFAGVSALISRTAETQRRAREVLRASNDVLDQKVRGRTRELAQAVEQLQAEIAEHRKTETELRDSEARIEFALEAAEVGRLDVDLRTGIANRSRRHDLIFGFDEDLRQWTWSMMLDQIVPEDRARVGDAIDAAVQVGKTLEVDCRIFSREHTVRWISMRGRMRLDESGNPRSMLGIVADISDRKFSEHRLRTQFQRLSLLDEITRAIGQRQDLPSVFQVVIRTLENSLPVDFACISLYDPAGETLTVTCIGARSEALGLELALHPNSRILIDQNGLSRCVRGQLVYENDLAAMPFPFPERLARAGLRAMVAAPLLVESNVFGVLLTARRAANSFSSGECEFLRQLSEHVALAAHQGQIYTALQQAYDDLRQSQHTVMQQERLRALGQMASGIAHDINNALSPVSLYTEWLLEAERNLSERARQYLTTIQRAIGDVAQTVARMREFYRQREPELTLTPVELGPLVRQVLDLTRARWSDIPQQRGITIRVRADLAEGLPLIAGVESEIREALTNLVFNALDAMPEGGTLTLRTEAARSRDGDPAHVELDVQDSGSGMDEDTRKRCLEPFFTTKGERGTGLGLAMVYGVVQRHNAQLEIESARGVGTTVRLTFPAIETATGKGQQDSPELLPDRLRILVVDDDPLLINSLRDTLESDGHVVVTANGGKEGIEAFKGAADGREQFAVVITDLGMPYVDGRKVAAQVKAISASTPVIMLTGWGQRLVAEEGVPQNVDYVLNKPPKLRELRSALATATLQTGDTAMSTELVGHGK